MKKIHTPFQLALIQQKCSNNIENNLHASIKKIKEAANKGAKIILLSELHANLYFCQTKDDSKFKLAESIPGSKTDLFSKIAKELQIILVISIFEKSTSGKFYNTAIVINEEGEIIGKYRKSHIPSCLEYNEKYYFSKGDTGFQVIDTSVGKLGILICYDQWFPEAARALALKGAELILIPTAIGFCTTDSKQEQKEQLEAWKIIQRSHAIANGIHIATCNRVGFESKTPSSETGIDFWGNSFVCGPFGKIISHLEQQEDIVHVNIDLEENKKTAKIWPFLQERESKNA